MKAMKILGLIFLVAALIVLFFVPENPPPSEWDIRTENLSWRSVALLSLLFFGAILMICSKITKEQWQEVRHFLREICKK